MSRHNLRTVVGFEVTRTLTKKRFWVITLVVPLAIAIVITLVVLSNTTTDATISSQNEARLTFLYSDASGYVDPAIAAGLGGTQVTDAEPAIAEVKSARVDAFFQYPERPGSEPILVYGVDRGIFDNGEYSAVATQLLVVSAQSAIGNPTLAALARGDIPVTATTYEDGTESAGIYGAIPALMFLVLFYVVILLLSNRMLSSTLEEKENRVTEMILTTLNPTTLLSGKVIALFIVGFVQIVVFATPVVFAYAFFRSSLNLPDLNLSALRFDPGQMVVGTLLLVGGFTLFTGTLVALGAIMPTAQDAGQLFGVLMILIFVPFYAVTLVVSDPQSFIVQVFTYFPYTAPVTGLLRNGFGSLSPVEAALVIGELFVLGVIMLRLAVRLFRYGSIEYSRKVSLGSVFGRRRAPDEAVRRGPDA